jgi:hypothetical protein
MRAWKRDLLRHESKTGTTLLAERRAFNRYLRGGGDPDFRMLATEEEFHEVTKPFILMVKMQGCEPCNQAHKIHKTLNLQNAVVYIDSQNTSLQRTVLPEEVQMFPTYFAVDTEGNVTKKETLKDAQEAIIQ